tara:strand:+ start:533 stop:1975 length:1443 start_codon:yes stop_codon:yes gene_type:complete
MAKLSESLFQSIRDFGKQDPAAPARRLAQASPYKQMGTTDPLARRVGSLFGNLGVDTSYMQTGQERADAAVEGIDVSKPEGIAKAMIARAQYIQDPAAQQALILKAQEIMQAEQEKQAAQAAALQQTQQKEVFIRTLIAQANEANRPDIAQMLAGAGINIDDKILQETVKELREVRTNQVEKVNSLAGRKIRYTQAGLPLEQWNDATIRGMSPDSFKELISGKTERSKAKNDFFKTVDGTTVAYRVNDFSGQVENPQYGIDPEAKQWVNASELGLLPAPKVTVNENFAMNKEVNAKIVEMGMSSFEQLNEQAGDAQRGLITNQIALDNIDKAYLNLGAGQVLGLDRLGEFIATATGQEYDSTNIAATETFVISRIKEMATFIKALGSGTGLSDKDAELALQAVAGDKSLNRETIRGVLEEFMAAQRFVIEQNDKAINILSQDKNLTRSDYLELITLSSEGRPPSAKPAGTQVGRFTVREG